MAYPPCSVIITTRNRADQLRRSIQSVAGQTVRPLELIVVDDCSAYSNESVIAEGGSIGLEVRYERLTERAGAPTVRNIGAERAHGEVLMFLDDDDAWEPEKIETQLALFEQHADTGTVYTGMLAVDDTTGNVLHASRNHYSGYAWPGILFRNFIGPTSAVAVRKELFHRVGGFDPRLPALQDYDLWLRLCMASRVLYDGAHNLRFSGVSRADERISDRVGSYQAGFEYLREKYRADLGRLTFWQRQKFSAQTRLVVASKYLERGSYASAALQLMAGCGAYPPTLLRLSRAALSHFASRS